VDFQETWYKIHVTLFVFLMLYYQCDKLGNHVNLFSVGDSGIT